MSCLILVLALGLPHIALSQDASKENKTVNVCENPEVKQTGDQFLNCFNNTVMHSIDTNNPACNSFETDLKAYLKVANACYNIKVVDKEGADNFIELIKYSIMNGKFADFVNDTGKNCILKARKRIFNCVKDELKITQTIPDNEANATAANERHKFMLLGMTSMTVDKKSCNQAMRIKVCTQRVMWDMCGNQNDLLYVSSLFDFMLSHCSRDMQDWMGHNDEKPVVQGTVSVKTDKSARTTHALLGVLLALAILAIFYTCVRDCRAPRGQWKALNERISMSMINRKRSLVHNEAGQEAN